MVANGQHGVNGVNARKAVEAEMSREPEKKLPGIGSCDGAKEEITVCDNEVQ